MQNVERTSPVGGRVPARQSGSKDLPRTRQGLGRPRILPFADLSELVRGHSSDRGSAYWEVWRTRPRPCRVDASVGVHRGDPSTDFDDDKSGYRLVVEVDRTPLLLDWGLAFGDAVHQLRSVLDNVTWYLSQLNGFVPRNPERVSFPMCTTEDKWTGERPTGGPQDSPC